MDLRNPRLRLIFVAALALVWMAAALVRLGYLQLFCYAEYLARAQRQQQRVIEVSPTRGVIYDRNFRELAMSLPADSCFAVPAEIGDPEMAARLLARVLNTSPEEIETRLSSSRAFVWVARKLSPQQVQRVQALNLRGIYFQKESERFYPKRELAAHVLGYVDIDQKGLGGLEYALNGALRSKPGKMLVLADARRRWFDRAEKGSEGVASAVLTLDEKIQYIAEKELARAIHDTHAQAGTILVQDPSSGALLALANWPTFNPNAASDSPEEARMDRAVGALYEPGSTFKLITLAAALEEGLTRPGEVFDCQNGAIYIAGHRIRDHKPYGLLNVADILANSSDVGAIKIALRLGPPAFYQYIRAFGFGSATGVDLPGESKGLLRRPENWSAISIGAVSMGQEVGVTPIQLITAISAIANGGWLYRPHLVKELRRAGRAQPLEIPEPRRAIGARTAATLRHMMEGAILRGTGRLARLDGYTAGGKTGTAQKIDPATGRYSRKQHIASFVGFAPLNTPAVTVLVVLDSPVGLDEGGTAAAPVFKRVMQQVLEYLEIPHDVPVSPEFLRASRGHATPAEIADVTDFSPSHDESTAEEPPLQPRLKPAHPQVAETVAFVEGQGIPVPLFRGKTVRDVTEQCLRMGFNPLLVGTGVAIEQVPEAGKLARRGSRITVRFARLASARMSSERAN